MALDPVPQNSSSRPSSTPTSDVHPLDLLSSLTTSYFHTLRVSSDEERLYRLRQFLQHSLCGNACLEQISDWMIVQRSPTKWEFLTTSKNSLSSFCDVARFLNLSPLALHFAQLMDYCENVLRIPFPNLNDWTSFANTKKPSLFQYRYLSGKTRPFTKVELAGKFLEHNLLLGFQKSRDSTSAAAENEKQSKKRIQASQLDLKPSAKASKVCTPLPPVIAEQPPILDPNRMMERIDAENFFRDVKRTFEARPEIYTQFCDLMISFKFGKISKADAIQNVNLLSQGYQDLLLGFYQFVPPEYRTNVHSNPPSAGEFWMEAMPNAVSTSAATFAGASSNDFTEVPVFEANKGHNLLPSVVAEQPPILDPNRTMERIDAENFFRDVKRTFEAQPEVYTQFCDLMISFKFGKISKADAIQNVNLLFQGYQDLRHGFYQFVPPEYRTNVQSNPPSTSVFAMEAMPNAVSTSAATFAKANSNDFAEVPVFEASQGHNFLPPVVAEQPPILDPNRTMERINAENFFRDVMRTCEARPEVYTQFCDLMKSFKFGKISKADTIQNVNLLFQGYQDLLVGFYQFVAPDCQCRMDLHTNTVVA